MDILFFFVRGKWPVCDILSQEQEQMPMEESANMLMMLASVVQRLNTTDFLQPYWNVMDIWAQYLNSTLPDPGNQLCTDDFVCNSGRLYINCLFCFRKDHHHTIVT